MRRANAVSPALRRGDRGAVAVEFAILLPVLCSILFGIIDYGLWFSDSLNVRQGVREAARQGVVQNFSPNSATAAGLAQKAKDQVGSVAGPSFARVVVPPGGWKRGQPLLVCAVVKADALIGFVPLPADGLIKSKTRMSIEVEATAIPAGSGATGTPSGGWAWCS